MGFIFNFFVFAVVFSTHFFALGNERGYSLEEPFSFELQVKLPQGFDVELVAQYVATEEFLMCKRVYSTSKKTFTAKIASQLKNDYKSLVAPVSWGDSCRSVLDSVTVNLTYQGDSEKINLIDLIFSDNDSEEGLVTLKERLNFTLYPLFDNKSLNKSFGIYSSEVKDLDSLIVISRPMKPIVFELNAISCGEALGSR